jgi:hypothetical protein
MINFVARFCSYASVEEFEMAKERTESEVANPNEIHVDAQGHLVIRDKAAAELIRDKIKAPPGGAQASGVSVGVVVSREF